jgi:hypothetical protein
MLYYPTTINREVAEFCLAGGLEAYPLAALAGADKVALDVAGAQLYLAVGALAVLAQLASDRARLGAGHAPSRRLHRARPPGLDKTYRSFLMPFRATPKPGDPA